MPRFLDWAVRLSTVPFTDLGKMGRDGELAKKRQVVIFVIIWVHPEHFTTKNLTPSKAESLSG